MANETGLIVQVDPDPTTGLFKRDNLSGDPNEIIPYNDPNAVNLNLVAGQTRVSADVNLVNRQLVAQNLVVLQPPPLPPPPPGTIIIDKDTAGTPFINSGETLIIKAGVTLTGSVTLKGGTLEMENGSTLTGSIIAIAGATIVLDNATVGDIDMFDGIEFRKSNGISGEVVIKRTQRVTKTNGISGEVVIKRSGTITITGVTVNGDVRVRKGANVTVTNNTITGDLIIRGTTGSCTGAPNNVTGRRVICQP